MVTTRVQAQRLSWRLELSVVLHMLLSTIGFLSEPFFIKLCNMPKVLIMIFLLFITLRGTIFALKVCRVTIAWKMLIVCTPGGRERGERK